MILFRNPLSAALIAVLFASACSLAPEYHRPAVAAIPADFKEAPGWRTAVPSDAVARGAWWLLFGDPVLADLEGKVVVSNQNLAAARAAYAQASALVSEQRAGFFPTVDTSVNATRAGNFGSKGPRSGTLITPRIGATWEPDLWGRVSDSVAQAGAQAEASAADLVSATLSAQGQLALDYVQLRGIEAQKKILDDTAAAYAEALKITRNRYNQGVAARSDVLQAETVWRNARGDSAVLDQQRALLEHAIAVLAGENPSNFTLPPAPGKLPVPEIPAIIPSALLERRPDIASAERLVAAANANIGIQRSAFFPTVTLTANAASASSSIGQLFSVATSVWSLGVTGALTLLDFGARSALVDQARAAYEQNVAVYRQTVLSAFQDTEDQLAAGRVFAVVAAERRAAARAAIEAEKISLNEYVAGQIDYSSVIVAQTAALTSRLAEVQAVTNRQTAAVSLILAIGGHWVDVPLTQVTPVSG